MKNINKEKINIVVLYVYILSYILEGPLRYGLKVIHLSQFIYLRDLLMVFFFMFLLLALLKGKKFDKKVYLLFVVFFVSVFWGIYVNGILQTLFGIKNFLPMFFGLFIANNYLKNLTKIERFYKGAFYLICLGIIVQYIFIDLPWLNYEEEILGANIKGNMIDSIGGIPRLVGFGRSIFHNGILLVYSSIYIGKNYKKNKIITILSLFLGGTCILLTTAKGAIGAYFACAILGVMKSNTFNNLLIKNIIFISVFLMCYLPIYSILIGYSINYENLLELILFASLNDRLLNTWPDAYTIVNKYGNEFLGMGIGGVGAAQQYFSEIVEYSPLDNGFIYLFAQFGFFSFLFIFIILNYIWGANFKNKYDRLNLLFFVGMCIDGIVICVFEFPITLVQIGIILGNISLNYKNKEKLKKE